MPTPSNLRIHLVQVAKYHFLTKPIDANLAIKLMVESPLLKGRSGDSCRLRTYTPCTVACQLPHEPTFMNLAQERVYGYLRDLIGNFSVENTRKFIRFVTGSAVLSSSPIKTIFNSVAGLARRPIAHTYENTIELITPRIVTSIVKWCWFYLMMVDILGLWTSNCCWLDFGVLS